MHRWSQRRSAATQCFCTAACTQKSHNFVRIARKDVDVRKDVDNEKNWGG
jgi:hypothetical protein